MQIIFTDKINRKLFFKETIRSHGIYRLKRESTLVFAICKSGNMVKF